MKKGYIILGLFVLMAAGLFFSNKLGYISFDDIWLKTQLLTKQQGGEIRGQVEYAEGTVEKRAGEKDGWKTVKQGEVIKSGMEVRTLNNARVVITFEDGSVARMGSNGMLKLQSEENYLGINLFVGEIYNRVAKDMERKYAVVVDGYEVAALGTAFGVAKEKGQDPQVIVVESQVEVKGVSNQMMGIVAEGEKAQVSSRELKTEKVTQEDLDEEFLAWNIKNDKTHFNKTIALENKKEEAVAKKKEEEKKTVVQKETKKQTISKKDKKVEKEDNDDYATGISLSGRADDTKARFNWTISGGKAPKGFKVVKSKQPNPVFPGDDYLYIKDSNDRSAVWKGFKKDKTYYFRVCVYKGGKCGAYSNNVEIEFDN